MRPLLPLLPPLLSQPEYDFELELFELLLDFEVLDLDALLRSSRSVGESPPLVLPEEDVLEPPELEPPIELDLPLEDCVRSPPPERLSDGESRPQPGLA
ncbi:hypothetical protein IP76_20515 [Rhizobium sp. AAP43]|nr:hypothetical protein IP76_20515 [Rhizobium sp. AAP43]